LTALAIADDLGAVIVIAIFYTDSISWMNLFIAGVIYLIMIIMGYKKVYVLYPYLIGGLIMWYFMLHSGVHATITGVLLAFAIPFGDGGKNATSYRLQYFLHKPVAFIILPIFALANTCILLGDNWTDSLLQANSIGIFLGLVIGKPVGIVLFSYAAVFLKYCQLPFGVRWRHLIGTGFLAGIGFTMSIFVSILAFDSPSLINFSQIMVLIASVVAAVLGWIWFNIFVAKMTTQEIVQEQLENTEEE
jgi:NhaA family Na+:H+ antiporter